MWFEMKFFIFPHNHHTNLSIYRMYGAVFQYCKHIALSLSWRSKTRPQPSIPYWWQNTDYQIAQAYDQKDDHLRDQGKDYVEDMEKPPTWSPPVMTWWLQPRAVSNCEFQAQFASLFILDCVAQSDLGVELCFFVDRFFVFQKFDQKNPLCIPEYCNKNFSSRWNSFKFIQISSELALLCWSTASTDVLFQKVEQALVPNHSLRKQIITNIVVE